MKSNLLRELYMDELAFLYSAENQLIKALPEMAKTPDSGQLRAAFEEHIKQTQEHASRLEKIFNTLQNTLQESPKNEKWKSMEGLVEEGSESIEANLETSEPSAGPVATAQRAEHYEIARDDGVGMYANLLGAISIVSLLEETLAQEKAAGQKLIEISEQIKAIATEAEDSAPESSGRNANSTDREITRNTRAAIVDDKSLSTCTHNMKIGTQDGEVTRKGPIRTEKEKN